MAAALAGPPGSKPPVVSSDRPTPNQSIYLQNLPEKLQKDDLRRALYMLFTAYGPVLDVTALKTKKMRGQAHILFRDTQSAAQALKSCQGLDFFGREMKISYSKNRSDTLAKLTGTFNSPATEEQSRQAAQTQSSFVMPPGVAQAGATVPPPGAPSGLPPPPGMPQANGAAGLKAPESGGAANAPSPQGTKRQRDEGDSDASMDDDDDDGAMDMSDSD